MGSCRRVVRSLNNWLGTFLLQGCCENKFNTRKEYIEDEIKKDEAAEELEVEEDFGTGKFAKYQQILWDTFEKPHKSKVAKVQFNIPF